VNGSGRGSGRGCPEAIEGGIDTASGWRNGAAKGVEADDVTNFGAGRADLGGTSFEQFRTVRNRGGSAGDNGEAW
jgi:hypothetical protein